MPLQVKMGAMMQCTFGLAPSSLVVLVPTVLGEGPPAANIADNVPIANIPPFGMCNSLANPEVAAATAAALGVLTPMPCVPVIPAPWIPSSPSPLIRGMPALTQTCQCMCAWAGVITFTNPGCTKTMSGS